MVDSVCMHVHDRSHCERFLMKTLLYSFDFVQHVLGLPLTAIIMLINQIAAQCQSW